MLIKKILFPIEFTDRCRIAGGYVVDLATAHDAQVILLHVIPPIDREVGLPDFSSPALATLVERRKGAGTKKVETVRAGGGGG